MKTVRLSVDPIAVVAVLVMIVCGYIAYSVYIQEKYDVYTSEEEINHAKESNFGFVANYL